MASARRILPILVFFVLALVISGSVLNFDDKDLVEPMASVHSLSDYKNAISQNQILDVQPVRDLSFKIDEFVGAALGHSTLHLTNVLVFVIAVFFLFQILCLLTPDAPMLAWCLCLLTLLHPVAINSVAWIASRKHLLSAMFILMATFTALGPWSRRGRIWPSLLIFALYTLAVFSQPINLLWPLWLAFFAFRKNRLFEKQTVILGCGLAAIALAAAVLNLHYYGGEAYLSRSVAAKFVPEGYSAFNNRILAFGRYAYQLLLGTHPSVPSYSPELWIAFPGLVMLVGAAYLLFKRANAAAWDWVVFLVLPLAVIYVRPTHHIGWDTYILTSLFGFVILLASQWRAGPRLGKKSLALLGAMALLYLYTDIKVIPVWKTDDQAWEYAYHLEPANVMAGEGYAKALLHSGQTEAAAPVIEGYQKNYPHSPALGYLLGRLYYDLPVSNDRKRELFEKSANDGPWFAYFHAAFCARLGDFSCSVREGPRAILDAPERARLILGHESAGVAASYVVMCEKSGRADCAELEKSLKSNLKGPLWDQSVFDSRYAALKAPQ